jgi:dimethylamine/trimethylamine dehydrogenase
MALGGRVTAERRLPGLSAWGRVVDYRLGQLAPMVNVQTYLDSALTVEDVLAMGTQHVAIATGARWRRDAVARLHLAPVPTDAAMPIFTPDDLMAGLGPVTGRVVIYDDDHFYMGSVLAELLVGRGCRVEFVTPATKVAEWTENTLEQAVIQRRMLEIGVSLHLSQAVETVSAGAVGLGCTYTGRATKLDCDAVVMVTSRLPNDALYPALMARQGEWGGLLSVKLIGDAAAPGPIAWATYAGRRYAEELDAPELGDALRFRREIAALADR